MKFQMTYPFCFYKKISLTFFLLFFITFSFAQDQFGGHIFGQDWQIIKTDAIKIIYPKGMELQAQRIGNIINYMDKNNRQSIGEKRNRIDMILQTQTVIPNGYVALAPFRSEFFSTPPQSNTFLGSLDWLDVLAIHEYRHVQQSSNENRGLTAVFRVLQGQNGWALMSSLSVPNWFSEGDAVIAETALTNAGRGRAAFFTMEQRALALAKKDYSYAKHRNGSFKHLLPNHYPLGYMILNQTRKDHGNEITANILHDAASYRGIIYPFSRAMKRHTGKTTEGMYDHAWEENKKKWNTHLENANVQPTTAITTTPRRTVTNYRFPRHLEDGSIIAIKSSYEKTAMVVHLENGKEKKLTNIGFNLGSFLSYGGGKVAWTELSLNPRRGYQSFSNIVLFDLKNKTKIRLTQKSRYFSPVVSPDGSTIAAVHITPAQENKLVLLDAQTGIVKQSLKNPNNYFLSRPTWSSDGKYLISVAKHNSNLTLLKINLSNNRTTELLPWSAQVLDAPNVHNEKVYFSAGFSGIDNIYYTDLNASQKVYQVSSVPVGAYEPTVSPNGNDVVFSEFSNMGYGLSMTSNSARSSQSITIEQPNNQAIYNSVAIESEGGNILEKISTQQYTPKRYKGLLTGLKLHSWNFTPSVAQPSLNLLFNNILNDVSIVAGGGINRNEDNASFYNASINIARWYPVVSLTGARQARSTDFYSNSGDSLATQKFDENILGGTVSLPLQWLKGNFSTGINLSVGFNQRMLSSISAEGNNFPDYNFGAYHLGFSVSSIRRRARQNVGPRLGLSLNARYIQSTNDLSNEKIQTKGIIYLPGIRPNHNIKITGGYQKELLSNSYQFSDNFEYPRGYEAPINDNFTAFTFNYGFPLFYPDFGIWGITYFKRIRANLFYDAGVGDIESIDRDSKYRSWGVELIFDNQHFNALPLSFGLRQSFLLDDDLLNPNRKRFFRFFAESLF